MHPKDKVILELLTQLTQSITVLHEAIGQEDPNVAKELIYAIEPNLQSALHTIDHLYRLSFTKE